MLSPIHGGGVARTYTNRKGLRTAAAKAAVNMNMGGDDNKSNNSREGEEEIEEDDGDDDEGEDIFKNRIDQVFGPIIPSFFQAIGSVSVL